MKGFTVLGWLGLGAIVFQFAIAGDLERIPFNNLGLTVDLGVGLWAWPMPMDLDGDGCVELVVNCPDKPYNGVYVFKPEHGTGGAVCFKPGVRISGGEQNVQVSYLHGAPQVLTPGCMHPAFASVGLAQPVKISGVKPNPHHNPVRANMWRAVDFDGDGVQDLIAGVGDWKEYGWDNAYDRHGIWKNGPLHGYIYWMRNRASDAAPDYAAPVLLQAGGKVLDVFGWPSPNFADWDGDGDLDLICGEFLDSFTYFENVGTRTEPHYAIGRRMRTADGAYLAMHLQMITPTAFDWDGDQRLDLICGDEDGRVAFLRNTGKRDATKTPIFDAPIYFQQIAQDLKFGALVTPVGVDFDRDGDWDLICGNSAGNIALFENLSGKGIEHPKWAAPRLLTVMGQPLRIMAGANGSIQGPCEAKWGYTTQTVCDWDGDGMLDLVVNSILGNVVWYRGRGGADFEAARPVDVAWAGAQPELSYGWRKPEGKGLLTQWRTTPVTIDWNKDGLVDLVMLDQEGYLAYFERGQKEGQRVLKAPQRIFCDEQGKALQLNAKRGGGSGRRKLCLVDWDGDGRVDILANSQNAIFYRQVKAEGGKVYFRNCGNLHAKNIEGHDVSPTSVDFDNNGIPDFIGGAEDGHLYYLRNPAANTAASEVR